MLNREAVRDFVVNCLGCGCPESVFQTIEFQEGEAADSGLSLLSRINVGNRLLIWMVSADDLISPEAQLQSLIRQGVAERDSKGFNRLRLVILSDDEAKTESSPSPFFTSIPLPDDRVHFHIVRRADVSFLCLPSGPDYD